MRGSVTSNKLEASRRRTVRSARISRTVPSSADREAILGGEDGLSPGCPLSGGAGGAIWAIEKTWRVGERTGSEADTAGRALDVGTGGGLINVDRAATTGEPSTFGGCAAATSGSGDEGALGAGLASPAPGLSPSWSLVEVPPVDTSTPKVTNRRMTFRSFGSAASTPPAVARAKRRTSSGERSMDPPVRT